MEEEFEDTLGEDKANWNFAFFLIVFVIVVTGVYYVVNLIRTKCCPKNVSFKEYLSKRWRYWDGDEVRVVIAARVAIAHWARLILVGTSFDVLLVLFFSNLTFLCFIKKNSRMSENEKWYYYF